MARYIDAEIALEKMKNWHTKESLITCVKGTPTADVAEIIHAKWEISSDGYYPYCSHCMSEPENGVRSKYCPECGARMDGVKNE